MKNLFRSFGLGLVSMSMVIVPVLGFLNPSVVHAAPTEFITTWKTDNAGFSSSNQISIPTAPLGTYNYSVDWGDSTTSTGLTGDALHTYSTPGTYTVTISGVFPQIFFNNGTNTDASKILSIEQWGSRQWTSMFAAFAGCNNLVINASDAPDLSQATDMMYMFLNATSINSDVSAWDVSTITNMYGVFQSATSFNQDVSDWNVSNVTNMGYMFENATAFNNGGQPLDWGVKTADVTNMNALFMFGTSFNQDVSAWDVSSVGNMRSMFHGATSFNNGGQPLDWGVKTASVTTMADLFNGATVFNQPINDWDTSAVTSMYYMFQAASTFNQPLNNWNMSHVTDVNNMFADAASFNQDISDWDISSINSTPNMFGGASSFNNGGQPMDWGNKTSVLVSLYSMFDRAYAFNQDISGWDVSNVTSMSYMLSQTTSFNQDLSAWDVSSVTDMSTMLVGSGLSVANYDALLESWSQQSVQTGVILDASSEYCNATDARDVLTVTHGWIVTDGGLKAECVTPDPVVVVQNASSGRSTPWGVGLMTEVKAPTSSIKMNYHFTRTLKQGMKGDDVVMLQKFLGITPVASKNFGPKTKAALVVYQKSHGLVADGIFGAKSRATVEAELNK